MIFSDGESRLTRDASQSHRGKWRLSLSGRDRRRIDTAGALRGLNQGCQRVEVRKEPYILPSIAANI